MGRTKVKIEFIANKKARASMFKRRKQGLIKKLQQLVTLCDVDACMLIHFPDAPEIWPPGEIRRMIDLYRAKKTQDSNSGTRGIKTCGVSDFSLDPKKTQDLNVGVAPHFALDNKFLCTQGPMSIVPYFHIPPHYSSMDPQWQWMGAVVDSAGGLSENTSGGPQAQFFQRCGYTPPNLHQSLMTSSLDHDLNLDDITWTFDFV